MSAHEILRRRYAFKSPDGDSDKSIYLEDEKGNRNHFLLISCGDNSQITIFQRVNDIKNRWDPHDSNGQPMTIESYEDALIFLSEQGYNRKNTKKGGNDK